MTMFTVTIKDRDGTWTGQRFANDINAACQSAQKVADENFINGTVVAVVEMTQEETDEVMGN